jgi:hypothetical protein
MSELHRDYVLALVKMGKWKIVETEAKKDEGRYKVQQTEGVTQAPRTLILDVYSFYFSDMPSVIYYKTGDDPSYRGRY